MFRSPQRPRRFRPQLEALEDRLTPALPFSFLQAGFTQELYGVGNTFFGGVAFAPDGDPLVDECRASGSPLHRFDSQSTIVVNGTTIHPETIIPSNAGCGLTNHPNGALYSNIGSGVVKLDANTGATLAGPFGSGGNVLGIAADPQTGNLAYVGSDGTIFFVNAALTTSGTFSSATTGKFVDGIFFDPTGNFLFLSNRTDNVVTIVRRDGSLVQNVPVGREPDGIAFHVVGEKFVVTNNTDGSMTRFDFPNNDFSQTPTVSVFANGGFRGDLTQVGPDGFLYITQDGTHFLDDTTSFSQNSLVRIGPGFAAPPGVATDVDITAKVRVFYPKRYKFNPANGQFSGFITLVNTSGANIAGPITLVFKQLPRGVTLVAGDGTLGTKDGKPALTVPDGISKDAPLRIFFVLKNPLKQHLSTFQIGFPVAIFAGAGTAS